MAEAFAARPDIDRAKFAQKIGKSRDYINRLVNLGTANPPPELLGKICEELGVSVAHIVSGEDASEEREQVVRRILSADAATIRRVRRALDLFEEDP